MEEGGQDRHRRLIANAQPELQCQGCSLHAGEVQENGNIWKAPNQRGKVSSAMGENEIENWYGSKGRETTLKLRNMKSITSTHSVIQQIN